MGFKKTTSLTIDSDLIEEARIRRINMSELAERGIFEGLGKEKKEINNTIDHCEFCEKKMQKATKDNMNGLNWLSPDEKWICPRCLKLKIKEIENATGYRK